MTSLRVLSAAGAVLALGMIAGPVAAAPLGAAVDGRTVTEGASDVTNVHYYGRRSYGYGGYSGYSYGYRWQPRTYSYGYYGYRPSYGGYYGYDYYKPSYRKYYGGDYGYYGGYKPYRGSYGSYGYRGWY